MSGELPTPSIHRYVLSITDEQTLRMPQGAHLLHIRPAHIGIGPANPVIELWCYVDLTRPSVERRFKVCGTGKRADVDVAGYVGTVVFDHPGGRGVWHVFDDGEQVAA